jgi:hypothetical protein
MSLLSLCILALNAYAHIQEIQLTSNDSQFHIAKPTSQLTQNDSVLFRIKGTKQVQLAHVNLHSCTPINNEIQLQNAPGFKSDILENGSTFMVNFDTPGVYFFADLLNCNIKGVVEVLALPVNPYHTKREEIKAKLKRDLELQATKENVIGVEYSQKIIVESTKIVVGAVRSSVIASSVDYALLGLGLFML